MRENPRRGVAVVQRRIVDASRSMSWDRLLAKEVFPKRGIHFEDWTGVDAVQLLERYRDKYCVCNDDVQGKAGIGMAIFATQARRVTDGMFTEAAAAVADQVSAGQLKQGLLYPLQSNILETEIKTAARVAELVLLPKARGLAEKFAIR